MLPPILFNVLAYGWSMIVVPQFFWGMFCMLRSLLQFEHFNFLANKIICTMLKGLGLGRASVCLPAYISFCRLPFIDVSLCLIIGEILAMNIKSLFDSFAYLNPPPFSGWRCEESFDAYRWYQEGKKFYIFYF